ncbi:MAG: HAMP domain-containing histidine kinase [Lachnospiraceae bacterium]|nr:HAMP domain-containing histidine kinase [Lachnospiraceae bacterium]
MIKTMRRRVILAAMLAFFAVIMMIAVLVNAVNYAVVTKRADETLNAILSFSEKNPEMPPGGGAPPLKPFMGLPDLEANYMTRFFTVRFDENGDVLFASTDYIAALDSEEAIRYGQDVLKKGKEHGYMKAYRYLMAEEDGVTEVIFLNTAREQQYMLSLRILTLIICVVSLVIVFLLVWLLSKRAIRPFAANIRQQKQFITDAGHELKTPLTSISTSIDVITMEQGESEWTENIRKQTRRMAKLVSELVTLSRLDEEMPLPGKENFSLSDTALETAEVFRPQADALGKTLAVDIESDIPLFGDPSAIRQMLSVLLDNALRYSEENSEIRFSVYRKSSRILIEVFNTCHYEEPPDTERLFDRFYRPDASRSTETGGNGVGLSIAKAVALAHSGKISASCPSGKTMTIKITF